MLTILTSCVCIFCFFICVRKGGVLLKWYRQVLTSFSIPTVSGAWPIVGHALRLNQDKIKLVEDINLISTEVDNLGGVAKLWFGPILLFVITDPEDALTVANTYFKKPYLISFSETWLGGGLVVSSPTIWQRHRKLLNPAFNQNILNGFLKVFNEQSRLLSERLQYETDKDFDPTSILQDVMFDSICQTTFGVRADSEIMTPYKNAKQQTEDIYMTRLRTTWMHLNFLYNRSQLKRDEDKAAEILHKTTMHILQQATVKRNKTSTTTHDDTKQFNFLDLMLDLRNSGLFSDQEIMNELDTLIFTGQDTLAVQLAFLFHLLGSHPEIQYRVRDEIIQVFEGTKRDVTKDDLSKLIFLDAVIKETMRLYPIGSIIMRESDQNVRLKNHTIPAGSIITISIWGINRSRIWGDDAAIFNPDRWFDTLPRHPAAFASFSIGRRNCLGKIYAMMSLKTTLVHILRRYVIKSNIDYLKLELDVMLKPASDQTIKLFLR